jgi:hypothetical protein
MKEGVVIRASDWKLGRTLVASDGFNGHHQDDVVRYRFAGRQRGALVIRIAPQ